MVSLFCISTLLNYTCSDIVDCVKENTFSLNSTILQDGLNSSLWTSNMPTIYGGMCHTFTYENIQNTDESVNDVELDPTLNYRIFIHDPKDHFLLKTFFPPIFLQYQIGKNIKAGYYDQYFITLTERHLLNRPEQPCEEEEDYDFLQCVKTSQAREVGCRPPWDIWSPHTIPPCQTMDQLKEYEKIDLRIFGATTKKTFVMRTGCKVPCNFKVSVRLGFFPKL